MLDNPRLTALKAIILFEVELLPAVIKHLQFPSPICREVDGQLALGRETISIERPAWERLR